ncbi:DUF5652 family protein [Micropruina sp.]|uniref:DUF5652 family protein n=1 Tax=Micropruina sp. TaxID=2737536 RepID=UPI0039E668D3
MARVASKPSDEGRGKRRVLVAVATADLALRAWALADLAARPQQKVRGPKAGWALALSVVNSVGLLPAAYLLWGRQTDADLR